MLVEQLRTQGPETERHGENAEVLPLVPVAVAVKFAWPAGFARIIMKVTVPLASVVSLVAMDFPPRKAREAPPAGVTPPPPPPGVVGAAMKPPGGSPPPGGRPANQNVGCLVPPPPGPAVGQQPDSIHVGANIVALDRNI